MAIPLSIRLDWSELDLFGHINNVAYFKYIQAARVHFWEQIGLYQDYLTSNSGPILANAACDFYKPLYYPGNVKITSTVNYIRSKSFSFTHNLYTDDNELVAKGSDIMVYFNFSEHLSEAIPEWLREKLIPHLNSDTQPSL